MSLPFRKAGGGYLNGVAGTIVGYSLDAKEWPAKKGGDPYTTLSVKLEIKPDGADAPVSQFLQAGFIYENHGISDDGQTLESDDDKGIIAEDTDFARFLMSAIEAGLSETPFQETNLRNFAGLVNQRFLFKREINVEGTEKFGKIPDKKGRVDKTGKPIGYNRDWLLVAEYLGEATAQPAKSRKASKAAPTSTAAKGGKANGAAKVDTEAQTEQATDVLLGILADAGKPVDRSGLSAKIVRYSTEHKFSEDAAEHNAIRESLRKLIGSEDFLGRQLGWTFDAKAKGQPVSLR